MTSQKIKLVLGRSKMPVGSIMLSPLPSPSYLRLKNEGYKKSEHQGVEGERLDQPDAEEHQRPRLLERLRLAVDAGDGLADQVPHARARADSTRAGRHADPNELKLLLEQYQHPYSVQKHTLAPFLFSFLFSAASPLQHIPSYLPSFPSAPPINSQCSSPAFIANSI